MRSINSMCRRLIIGSLLFTLLVGLFGVMPTIAQEEGVGLSDGTVLSGELTVWENASAWPTSEIFVGYPDPSVGFTVDSTSGYNAWGPYSSSEGALDGACQTANNRLNNDGFSPVTVNGQAFTDIESCKALELIGTAPNGSDSSEPVADTAPVDESSEDGAVSLDALTVGNDDTQTSDGTGEGAPMVADPGVYTADTMAESGVDCRAAESAALTVDSSELDGSIYGHDASTSLPEGADVIAGGKAIPAGVCINSGLILVRINHFGVGGQEDVRPLQVGDGLVVYCGKRGKLAFDCWENYVSVDDASYAACEQAVGDLATIDIEGAFNYRFSSITFTLGGTSYTATNETVCR